MADSEQSSEKPVATTSLKRKDFSDNDKEDLDQLDNIFKRMKKNIPQQPYVLSTPSLYPYQHHSRQEAQAWMMGSLFKPDEEHLQYRTFYFREPYVDTFTLQHGEDDEPEPEPPRPKSQASMTSAASQGPKKKISLSDYKSKQPNGVITPGSKRVSPNLPPTKPNASVPAKPQPAQAQVPPAVPPKPDHTTLPKKPAAPDAHANRQKHVRQTSSSQKMEASETKAAVDKSNPSNSTPHGLPPLLSPVDEPLSNPHGLPAILSPTLPANIQAELDRLGSEDQRKRADSNASASSSDRKGQQQLQVPGSSIKTKDAKNNSTKVLTPTSGASPAMDATKDAGQTENRLLVKLKYTTKTKDAIKGVLAPKKDAPPREKRERKEPPKIRSVPASQAKAAEEHTAKSKPAPKAAPRRPEPSTTPMTKAPIPTLKVAEKRPRTEDDTPQVPVKRPRASSMLERPITPKEQILSSPGASNKSSTQKNPATNSTPRKDLKTINMLRTTSAESYDSTPGRSGTTLNNSTKHLDVKAPTSAPLNGKKQNDIAHMQHLSMKLNQKGRSLKHESQKFEHEKGSKLTKDDQKRAAVMGLECILSYMTAYHAQDLSFQLRGRSPEVQGTWKTLLPLCTSYARLTKESPHLDGFRSYLGAVIAAHICTLVAPRASNPRPHDSPHDLPHAELARQHLALSENLKLISQHYMELQRHTANARAALPMEELASVYPITWEGAEPNVAANSKPSDPTQLSGPYFLPIQNDTTPIQAVRFGLMFLAEFCETEGIPHRAKLNLDQPESNEEARRPTTTTS